jgi:hypothetical protein
MSTSVFRTLSVTFFFALVFHCPVGSAQTVEQVLSKCRESLERISSYEYTALATTDNGVRINFFFATEGEGYRYDQKGYVPFVPPEFRKSDFKVGYDGENHFRMRETSEIEVRPAKWSDGDGGFQDPFRICFQWLTERTLRADLLKNSAWQEFAKSCDEVVALDQVDGHSCQIVNGLRISDNSRFEIAFGDDVGYLPIRVRFKGLKKDARTEPRVEWLFSEFKHFRIDGISNYFPTKMIVRSLVVGRNAGVQTTTNLNVETLNINRPIPKQLFRLEYDPIERE